MSKEVIYDLLAQMAVVFGKAETKERLQYYAVELSEYSFDTVKAALEYCANELIKARGDDLPVFVKRFL